MHEKMKLETRPKLSERAESLCREIELLRAKGPFAQAQAAPALVEDAAALIRDLARVVEVFVMDR